MVQGAHSPLPTRALYPALRQPLFSMPQWVLWTATSPVSSVCLWVCPLGWGWGNIQNPQQAGSHAHLLDYSPDLASLVCCWVLCPGLSVYWNVVIQFSPPADLTVQQVSWSGGGDPSESLPH